MASEEQLTLSGLIKSVHQKLRDSAKQSDPNQVWREHLQNQELLNSYASAMHKLATCYWDKTMEISGKKDNNRIDWVVNSIRDYFTNLLILFRDKDDNIMKTMDETHLFEYNTYQIEKIKLLDVGSCYNPFSAFVDFEVTAIDIAPAQESVTYCDFLEVPVMDAVSACTPIMNGLPKSFYDAVVFSLLLEYLPSSAQRLQCCQKAYDVLKPEGILLIITPDSCHQGANAKLMKNWRYTLGLIGFARIKIEKLEHLTCMVFRKCIFKKVAERWCMLYKEAYMEPVLNIPQDLNKSFFVGDDKIGKEPPVQMDGNILEIKSMFEGLPFMSDE